MRKYDPAYIRQVRADIEKRIIEIAPATKACAVANKWWFLVILASVAIGFAIARLTG